MKAIKIIALALLTVLAVGSIIVMVSCDKQEPIEQPQDEFVAAQTAKDALFAEHPMVKSLPSNMIVNVKLEAQAVGISQGRKWAMVNVKCDVFPATIPISAISLIIDYDETRMFCEPFNYGSIHPNLYTSLQSGMGGIYGGRSGGRVYFCYYSIVPMMFTPSAGSYILFKLTFLDVISPAVVNFDISKPWNCEFSPDGWQAIPMTFTNLTL